VAMASDCWAMKWSICSKVGDRVVVVVVGIIVAVVIYW